MVYEDLCHFTVCNCNSYIIQTDEGGAAEKKPRQTGSMIAHNDDIVTRMKNIELIELGKCRIKPWYFSPYPQVRIKIGKCD
jgi:hypothetical protein